MKKSLKTSVFLTILALVFTIGLTFTAVELPKLADSFLHNKVNFPGLVTGQNTETEYKTKLYMKQYHLREIGYIALGVVILLIIIGFIKNKRGLTSTGAILLFLPIFGHFAATMFFLGGLAFFRLLWLPFLDVSFDIMKLGDTVLLPYKGILGFFNLFGINLYKSLPFIITGIGFFIFMLGTLAWFHSKIKKKKVADFWIYKFSRHPQYLGWIIWSYGVMFLPGNNMKLSYNLSNTLPWLLTTIIIIGVALFEELKMKKIGGAEYQEFQQRTPFLFPLPKFITNLIKTPLRLLFKKKYFNRRREILTILIFYTGICILLSGIYTGIIFKSKSNVLLTHQRMDKIVQKIKKTHSRVVIRKELKRLVESGDNAINSLLSLLSEEWHIIRWYTTDALGNFQSQEVTQALIRLLHDRERWVRRAAAGSLAKIKSKEAVVPLTEALLDSKRDMAATAARALGQIGDKRALDPLTNALFNTNYRIAGAVAQALADLGDKESIPFLIRCLAEREECPYNQVGSALLKLGSDQAINAFILGIKDATWWKRQGSIKGLARINSPQALKKIIDSLKDSDERVRRTAAWVLRNLDFKDALEPLREMLDDPDFEVRMYAKDAIKTLEQEE